MSEAVREVSQRPATRAELLFEVRALDARLNACQAGLSSMSITWFSRPRSSEMTSRVSSSGTLRLPEKLVPPPYGMITASAATARSTMSCTSASSPG